MVEGRTWSSSSPHRCINNASTCGTSLTEHLLNSGRRLQTSKRARKSPCNWAGQKKKKSERNGMWPAPLGGSCERGKVSTHRKVPSLAGRSARTEGEFQSPEKTATGLRRTKQRETYTNDLCQPALPSLRCLSVGAARGWVLRVRLQRSDPEERMGVGFMKTAWEG